jgi:hypothetical protein
MNSSSIWMGCLLFLIPDGITHIEKMPEVFGRELIPEEWQEFYLSCLCYNQI